MTIFVITDMSMLLPLRGRFLPAEGKGGSDSSYMAMLAIADNWPWSSQQSEAHIVAMAGPQVHAARQRYDCRALGLFSGAILSSFTDRSATIASSSSCFSGPLRRITMTLRNALTLIFVALASLLHLGLFGVVFLDCLVEPLDLVNEPM